MAFLNLVFYVRNISIWSFASASSSRINRLTILINMTCQELVCILKELGRRERRKGKKFPVYTTRIRINLYYKTFLRP